MKDSFILEIATNELTQFVNALSQKYNIPPSLLSFVIAKVNNKVNELAVQEVINEVVELEAKIAKIQSTSEQDGTAVKVSTDDFKPEEVQEHKMSARSKSVRKSGSIEDLINDLKASGVNVTENHVTSSARGEVVEEAK